MEVCLLLISGLRRKKLHITGIILMVFILSACIASIISVNDNCREGLDNAVIESDTPALNVEVIGTDLTDERLRSLEESQLVGRIRKSIIFSAYDPRFRNRIFQGVFIFRRYEPRFRQLDSSFSPTDRSAQPENGEMYVPISVLDDLGAQVGDTVEMSVNEKESLSLKIGGTVAEPAYGSKLSYFRSVFINDSEFDRLYNEYGNIVDLTMLEIYPSEKCSLSDDEFKKQLNLETGIVDISVSDMTRQEAINGAMIYPDVVCALLMVFLLFLAAVTIIAIQHSIITGTELDRTDIGIMQALGCTKRRLRLVSVLMYSVPQAAGAIAGLIAGAIYTSISGNYFQYYISVPCGRSASLLKSTAVLSLLFSVSVLCIIISTHNIGRVSPVKVISGRENDVYFDSLMNVPVSGRFLSLTIALRQITSSKKRYFSAVISAALLVFFMVSINALGDTVNSRDSMESMGEIFSDIYIEIVNEEDSENWISISSQCEDVIKNYSDIRRKYFLNFKECTIDGLKLPAVINGNDDAISIQEGRAAKYDNELTVTEFVAQENGLDIGKSINVSHNGKSAEYIITGIHQLQYENGRNIVISEAGGKRIGISGINSFYFSLEDNRRREEVMDALNEYWSREGHKPDRDIYFYSVSENSMNSYNTILDMVKLIVHLLSVVFSFLVIVMTCHRALLQERRDLGIYKAMGMHTSRLRFQFSLRFAMTAFIGSVFGILLSLMLSERILLLLLRCFAISTIKIVYNPVSFIIPTALVVSFCFVFAFIVSSKIRRISVTELISD